MLHLKYDDKTTHDKRIAVRNALCEHSQNIKNGDFKVLHEKDLWILFHLYDEIFFEDYFKRSFEGKLTLTLSRQMTRSAGITRTPKNIAKLPPKEQQFEIKISLDFLFTYYFTSREKFVNGIATKDPLDVLILVFEHELCHVIEFLFFFKSSCRGKRYKEIAFNIFGHTDNHHNMPTMPELSFLKYGFKPTDCVQFTHEGKELTGIISSIKKRAIVMVEDKKGTYYNKSGKRFAKYTVPLSQLKSISTV